MLNELNFMPVIEQILIIFIICKWVDGDNNDAKTHLEDLLNT